MKTTSGNKSWRSIRVIGVLIGLLLVAVGGIGTAYGGTIAVPSIFVLHRPLNPALITRTTGFGFAYGAGGSNRDLTNSAPSNCELKGFSDCAPDRSETRLVYGNLLEIAYIQYEGISNHQQEKDSRNSFRLNFNQTRYDYQGSIALKLGGFFSIGAYRRDTEERVRETFVDFSGQFTSKRKTETTNTGIGAHISLWDWLHFAYYKDGPIEPKNTKTKGRDFEIANEEGFQGGGLGFLINLGGPEERPNEIAFELFSLQSKAPLTNERATLNGINFEITLGYLVFYSQILQDANNNFFGGELLRDAQVSFATGVGWNGDLLQILVGRDPRYFTGMDGGAQVVIGFQF